MSSVDAIREPIVGREVIELGGQLVVNGRECVAAVVADAGAAVVAFYDALCVVRVDPDIVIVAVGRRDLGEGFAAVNRLPRAIGENPASVCVLWICEYVLVVPGTALKVAVVAHQLPGVAVIVGPINTTVFRFNRGVNATGLSRRNCHSDASQWPFGKSRIARNILPSVAAVSCSPQTTIRAA